VVDTSANNSDLSGVEALGSVGLERRGGDVVGRRVRSVEGVALFFIYLFYFSRKSTEETYKSATESSTVETLKDGHLGVGKGRGRLGLDDVSDVVNLIVVKLVLGSDIGDKVERLGTRTEIKGKKQRNSAGCTDRSASASAYTSARMHWAE